MSQIEATLDDQLPASFRNENERRVRTGTAAVPGQRPAPAGTAVIISTRGRPDIIAALVRQLDQQTRPPAHVFVIASSPDDAAELNLGRPNLTVHIGRTGSSHQRNDGLALAGSRFRYIAFFDDDFVPSRFWLEQMETIFETSPDVAGVTGFLLEDGAMTEGIRLDVAQAMVRIRDRDPRRSDALHDSLAFGGNMGCNMAFRFSALRDVKFDERLPLYAWLEDHDFRGQVEQHGSVVRADALWGVHLGHKKGRVRGVTLGYAQVANALYLARKGTVPAPYLAKLVGKNLLVNAVRSLRPEPYVDRRGRMLGNMFALADLVRGRLAPERILEF